MVWLNKCLTNTSKHHPDPIPNLPPGTLSIQNEDLNYYSHTDPTLQVPAVVKVPVQPGETNTAVVVA